MDFLRNGRGNSHVAFGLARWAFRPPGWQAKGCGRTSTSVRHYLVATSHGKCDAVAAL